MSQLHPLIHTICEKRKLLVSEVITKSKGSKDKVFARQLICFVLRKKNELTFESIGSIIKRDHSTVVHSIDVINDYAQTDIEKRDEIIKTLEYFNLKESILPNPLI